MYIAVATLWLAAASLAQTRHFLLEEIAMDPAQRQQFESAQRDYCAAVVRGGAPSCVVLSPTTFAKQDGYFAMLFFPSFAHYDEGTYTSKGLTPEQAQDLARRRDPTIKHNHESGFQEAFAAGSSLGARTALVEITDLEAHPGFEAAIVDSLRTMRSSAEGITVYRCIAGGNPSRLLVFRYLQRFALLDGLTPLSPSGKDGAAVTLWRQGVRSMKVTVMRQRAELGAYAH